MNYTHDIVAKFGGTSMAYPARAIEQLSADSAEPGVVVVSAPGVTPDWPIKATDMLREYQRNPTPHRAVQIRDRFGALVDAAVTGGHAVGAYSVVDGIQNELSLWQAENKPVEALGEYWSAKIFSALSGRDFIDATKLISFDQNGLDYSLTMRNARNRLGHLRRAAVVPGYYGTDRRGCVRVMERGGSDVTGAILALAMNSAEYHNWSDVDGFMSADPRQVQNARMIDIVTYREARELANGGAELLQKRVQEILGHTTIDTIMRNTFGQYGNRGTVVTTDRDTRDMPVIGVTGQADMLELSFHEFGLQESVGGTVGIFEELRRRKIPWEHAATATDDLSIFLSGLYRSEIKRVVKRLGSSRRLMRVEPAAMIHVVGEGLRQSGVMKMQVIGRLATSLSDAGIECMGATDVASSAALTFFVRPDKLQSAVSTTHDNLHLS